MVSTYKHEYLREGGREKFYILRGEGAVKTEQKEI